MSRLAVSIVAALLLAACADSPTATAPELGESSSSVKDGTPEGIGLLALLADPATSVELLDGPVGLDRRAAAGIVAHRDGKDGIPRTADDDRFDTIAEVDALPYVGESALTKLATYAGANGFVPTAGAPLGVFDGVAFSVDEGAAVLALANTAAQAQLDGEVGLDSRAAAAIVKARPIASVLALSRLSYVGTSALTKLKTATKQPASTGTTAQDVKAALETAAAGLWHTSESDYPLVAVLVPGAGTTPITAADIKTRIASIYQQRPGDTTLADREVEVVSLASLFDRYTQPQDWWEQSQLDAAPRWQALQELLRSRLVDVQVYRLGFRYHSPGYTAAYLSGAIDLYIVGRTADGALVGLWTVSVET